MQNKMLKDAGSFRDPSGNVYIFEENIYRSINHCYKEEWEHICQSGLLKEAVQKGFLLDSKECSQDQYPALPPEDEKTLYKMLEVKKLPFFSYPYEWCFSQLKDAALLTLDLHCLALKHGCILKDASAFNVQFLQGKPVFIDLLSFERYKEGQAWQAYGQFCTHFLAPLALMAHCDLRCGLLSHQWPSGIPLDLASKMLPLYSRFSLGLYLHLFLHSSMQQSHADGRKAMKKVQQSRLNLQKMLDVADSLRSTVKKLHLPKQTTEWGNYYEDTNYTERAKEAKILAVQGIVKNYTGNLAIDIGANNGFFSKLLCQQYKMVLATDVDHLAVEYNYKSIPPTNMLPLILDVTNPSSGLGFLGEERSSFITRCKADMLLALALCHHLVMTGGIPFPRIARFMASILNAGGIAIVEYIPKDDSQIQRLLAARDDVFTDYTFENFQNSFEQAGFTMLEKITLPETDRFLSVFCLKSE